MTKFIYETRKVYIFKLTPQNATEPAQNIRFVELTADHIDKMLKVMYVSRAGLQERFDRGDRCFAAMNGVEIVSYFWARFGDRRLDELFLEFKLKPNQAWFYNAITVKSARGRGYYPNIIRYMAKVLKAEGIKESFIDVEERNKSSICGIEKAGCRRLAKIRMNKLFSKFKYEVTVFDKVAWEQFSGVIKNPRNI